MFLSGIGFVYKTRRGTDPILEKARAWVILLLPTTQ